MNLKTRKKILVVDDDEAIIDFLHAKLGGAYDVVSTNAPEHVLKLAHDEHPDLVLCDIDMPDMDGGDVSAALYADALTRDIAVIFLTSLITPEELQAKRGEIAGRPALSKHSGSAEMLARIKKIID